MKFEFFNQELPKGVRDTLTPNEDFVRKAKGRFLAHFDARYRTHAQSSKFVSFMKVVVMAGAFAAVMVSVSVYADTANVPADSPLYPFKRLTEDVKLALASKDLQPELQAVYATRRANEIADLSERTPTSTLITGLTADFDSDVSSSLGDIESGNIKKQEVGSVCGRVAAIFSVSLAAREKLMENANLLARFEANCGAGVGAVTSASGTSSVTASTTIIVVPKGNASDSDASSSSLNNIRPRHLPVPLPLKFPEFKASSTDTESSTMNAADLEATVNHVLQ